MSYSKQYQVSDIEKITFKTWSRKIIALLLLGFDTKMCCDGSYRINLDKRGKPNHSFLLYKAIYSGMRPCKIELTL